MGLVGAGAVWWGLVVLMGSGGVWSGLVRSGVVWWFWFGRVGPRQNPHQEKGSNDSMFTTNAKSTHINGMISTNKHIGGAASNNTNED